MCADFSNCGIIISIAAIEEIIYPFIAHIRCAVWFTTDVDYDSKWNYKSSYILCPIDTRYSYCSLHDYIYYIFNYDVFPVDRFINPLTSIELF